MEAYQLESLQHTRKTLAGAVVRAKNALEDNQKRQSQLARQIRELEKEFEALFPAERQCKQELEKAEKQLAEHRRAHVLPEDKEAMLREFNEGAAIKHIHFSVNGEGNESIGGPMGGRYDLAEPIDRYESIEQLEEAIRQYKLSSFRKEIERAETTIWENDEKYGKIWPNHLYGPETHQQYIKRAKEQISLYETAKIEIFKLWTDSIWD